MSAATLEISIAMNMSLVPMGIPNVIYNYKGIYASKIVNILLLNN